MVEQNLEDRQLPIYIPISEYAKVFVITPDIYNLQVGRLDIVQKNLKGLLNRNSEDELEFVGIIFEHISKLVFEKRILKNPKKLIGEMPVCFFEWYDRGLKSWYGDENEAGSSIYAGLNHFSDEVIFTGS